MKYNKKESIEMWEMYKAEIRKEVTTKNSDITPIDPNERFQEWLLISTLILEKQNQYQDNIDLLQYIQKECTRYFIHHINWFKNQKCVDLFTNKIQFDCEHFHSVYTSIDYGIYSRENTYHPIFALDSFYQNASNKEKSSFFNGRAFGFVHISEDIPANYSKLFTENYVYQKLYDNIKCLDIKPDIIISIKNRLKNIQPISSETIQWKNQISNYIEIVEQEQGYTNTSNLKDSHTPYLTPKEVIIIGNALAITLLKNDHVDRRKLSKFLEQISGYPYDLLYEKAKCLNHFQYDLGNNYDKTIDRLLKTIDRLARKADLRTSSKLPFRTMRENILSKIKK